MPDHPELVSEKKYTEDFKTTILYCYSYGFSLNDENGKKKDDEKGKKKCRDTKRSSQKSRIKKILNNYVNWDNKNEKKQNKIRLINKASEAMKDNPFQRFYRFCRYIPVYSPSYYLHIIAALSPYFDRCDYESLKCDNYSYGEEDKDNFLRLAASFVNLTTMHMEKLLSKKISARTQLDETDKTYYMNSDEAAEIIKGFNLKEIKESILISALQKCLNEDYFSYTYFEGREKTPFVHLKKLEDMGLLLRKWSPGNTGHQRNTYWYLSQITIDKIINEGHLADSQFEQHLYSALDFFSRYYTFGEIGMYLLDRMDRNYNSPFRFRHEYFIQSLCDFHVIDLLNAIEEKKWCLIEYQHAMAGFDTKLLCYPLQIRVGSRNGREHLMYYDPIRHCYTALRIEFIKDITYYSFDKIKDVLLQSGVVESKETLASEILNAKVGINYLWGVTTPSLLEEGQVNNARLPINPKHITMQIRYDPKKEYYIKNRLYRECRHGIVTDLPEMSLIQFDIDVASPSELIPWIRSFYTRIEKLEGLDTGKYTLENDLSKMQKILEDGKLNSRESSGPREIWSVPKEILDRLGKSEDATSHKLIFNEIFSIYYYIFADMLVNLMKDADKRTEAELKQLVSFTKDKVIQKYSNRVGDATDAKLSREIIKMFLKNKFFIKMQENNEIMYSPIYKMDGRLDLYKQVIPLSIMEKRWLKTIITDPKIYLFLSENEVDHLRDFLAKDSSNPKPLSMNDIVCYDRYHILRKKTTENTTPDEKEVNENYRHIISTMLEGISCQVSLNITYRDNYSEIIEGEFDPVVIEYSKRNNSFQGYFMAHGQSGESFMIFNIPQIIEVTVAGNKFSHSEAEKKYDEFIEKNTAMVEFEFFDERNLADRILTEFSPWKRECVKDGNHYRVKLYYRRGIGEDRGEELDIVIRLMSFGGYLKFKDMTKGSIGQLIKERVDKQLELIREKDKIKDDGDSR